MNSRLIVAGIAMSLLVDGCASLPNGPTVMAMPGTGKSFDQFRVDDANCRMYAHYQLGGTPTEAENHSFVNSAAVGTALGTVAGAVLGGARGAGVGAVTGLALGSGVGVGQADASGYEGQRMYNMAYLQCMYASGEMVPVSGSFNTRHQTTYTPAPTNYPPPPPPASAPAGTGQ